MSELANCLKCLIKSDTPESGDYVLMHAVGHERSCLRRSHDTSIQEVIQCICGLYAMISLRSSRVQATQQFHPAFFHQLIIWVTH
jgi:hypothetical protein